MTDSINDKGIKKYEEMLGSFASLDPIQTNQNKQMVFLRVNHVNICCSA